MWTFVIQKAPAGFLCGHKYFSTEKSRDLDAQYQKNLPPVWSVTNNSIVARIEFSRPRLVVLCARVVRSFFLFVKRKISRPNWDRSRIFHEPSFVEFLDPSSSFRLLAKYDCAFRSQHVAKLFATWVHKIKKTAFKPLFILCTQLGSNQRPYP